VNSDSQFPYSGPLFLQFNVSFSLITAYHLMTLVNMPIRKLEVKHHFCTCFLCICWC